MIAIGIDPGVSGGMAVIRTFNNTIDLIAFKKATEQDIYDAIKAEQSCVSTFAVIEKVSASPQMGVVSAFTFGSSYGFLRGAMTGIVPFEAVSPQKWQKELGCLTKGYKNVSKARAQQLFPQLKITHAIADALLLAEYAKRLYHQRNGV
jgi:hypothetical protein